MGSGRVGGDLRWTGARQWVEPGTRFGGGWWFETFEHDRGWEKGDAVKRTRLWLAALIAVFALIVAACAGNDD